MVFQRSNLVTASLHVKSSDSRLAGDKKSDIELMLHYSFANKNATEKQFLYLLVF